jgi:hypothetical protein
MGSPLTQLRERYVFALALDTVGMFLDDFFFSLYDSTSPANLYSQRFPAP